MKIDNSGKPLGSNLVQSTPRRAGTTATASSAATGASSSPADSIETFSAKLQQLEATMASQPVFDEARVSEIRQAISDGKFSVRPDAIADKLVASVKQMLAGKDDSSQ